MIRWLDNLWSKKYDMITCFIHKLNKWHFSWFTSILYQSFKHGVTLLIHFTSYFLLQMWLKLSCIVLCDIRSHPWFWPNKSWIHNLSVCVCVSVTKCATTACLWASKTVWCLAVLLLLQPAQTNLSSPILFSICYQIDWWVQTQQGWICPPELLPWWCWTPPQVRLSLAHILLLLWSAAFRPEWGRSVRFFSHRLMVKCVYTKCWLVYIWH